MYFTTSFTILTSDVPELTVSIAAASLTSVTLGA
jgi:hypothetical protein